MTDNIPENLIKQAAAIGEYQGENDAYTREYSRAKATVQKAATLGALSLATALGATQLHDPADADGVKKGAAMGGLLAIGMGAGTIGTLGRRRRDITAQREIDRRAGLDTPVDHSNLAKLAKTHELPDGTVLVPPRDGRKEWTIDITKRSEVSVETDKAR